MITLKPFGDSFERREKNPAENRVSTVEYAVNIMGSTLEHLISAKQARAEAKYGKVMFVSPYEQLIEHNTVVPKKTEMPVITAPQAVLPKRETILDEPIEIDQLQFEAMSKDAKSDATTMAGQVSTIDPVEAELLKTIVEEKAEFQDKLAELKNSADQVAMSAAQSYQHIAEITQR